MEYVADHFLKRIPRPFLSNVPSPDLIKHTTGPLSWSDYMRTAFEVASMFEAATLKHAHKRLDEFPSVLDFGCGAGRIIQFFQTNQNVSGCDVNGPLVEFTTKNFPHADIRQTQPTPPLPWASGVFDLIISFSVFSHLEQESENLWLKELKRVGKSEAIYLVTVQGDWCLESKFDKARRAAIKAKGFHYFDIHKKTGSLMDFPENYGSSVHTSDYIRRVWGNTFDIMEIYYGRPAMAYDFEDLPEYHREALRQTRSMGQDLVVMRQKRHQE